MERPPLQLGAAAGAKVIATASTEAKRQHCTELGAHFVFDAGSDSLRDDIMAITEGHGVDVASIRSVEQSVRSPVE